MSGFLGFGLNYQNGGRKRLPRLPAGYVFLKDNAGRYLQDNKKQYLIVKKPAESAS